MPVDNLQAAPPRLWTGFQDDFTAHGTALKLTQARFRLDAALGSFRAVPPQLRHLVRFTLSPGDPATGLFSWRPLFSGFSGFTNVIVRATDDGVPNLTDARIVTIKIIAGPVITGVAKTSSSATVTWRTATGERYRLQFKNSLSLSSWNDVTRNDIIAAGFTASDTDTSLGAGDERYYRVVFFAKP